MAWNHSLLKLITYALAMGFTSVTALASETQSEPPLNANTCQNEQIRPFRITTYKMIKTAPLAQIPMPHSAGLLPRQPLIELVRDSSRYLQVTPYAVDEFGSPTRLFIESCADSICRPIFNLPKSLERDQKNDGSIGVNYLWELSS